MDPLGILFHHSPRGMGWADIEYAGSRATQIVGFLVEWETASPPAATPGAGTPVDLLKRIDFSKLPGWGVTGGELAFDKGSGGSGAAMIDIPYTPPEEYQLTIVARRASPKSINRLAVGLTVKDQQVAVYVAGSEAGSSGFSRVNGKSPGEDAASPAHSEAIFVDDAPRTIVLTVRKTALTLVVDGKELVRVPRGPQGPAFSIDKKTAAQVTVPFYLQYATDYRISKLELVPLGAAATVDPDRRAALWALAKAGASVTVVVPGKQPQIAKTTAELPAGPFKVEKLSVTGSKLDAAECVNLSGLVELQQLGLGGTAISAEGLRRIGPLPKLSSLEVYYTLIGDEGMKYMADTWNLTNLSSGSAGLTDEGLKHVARLPNLITVGLAQNKFSNSGLSHLAALRKLTDLDLRTMEIADPGLKHLETMTSLRKLMLQGTKVTTAGVAGAAKGPAQLHDRVGRSSKGGALSPTYPDGTPRRTGKTGWSISRLPLRANVRCSRGRAVTEGKTGQSQSGGDQHGPSARLCELPVGELMIDRWFDDSLGQR